MDWWGIGLIVAAGVAVVVYGYVDDRRKTRERDAAMLAPPKRDIPRFQPMAEAPAYLSELQARTRPDQLASTDLNAEAECYRITRSVAFTRAFAHQGDRKDPVAAAAGTFMLGTKGMPTAAHGLRGGDKP